MNTVSVVVLVVLGLVGLLGVLGLLGAYLVHKHWQRFEEKPPMRLLTVFVCLGLALFERLNIFDPLITALPPPPSVSPTPMELHASAANTIPVDFRNELLELEEWAKANKRDASRDAWAFWGLKIPAILASASAGVWAHFDLTTVSVIFGAVASLCVVIDGIHPRGMLRNTHLRAYHDIRILTTRMMAVWRSRNMNAKDDNTARRIIRDFEGERQRIAIYIRDAETALNPSSNRETP